MKRRIFLSAIFSFVLLFFARSSGAFDYGLTILEPDAIRKLSDDALTQAYVDTLIEVEAAKIFHIKAGFTPKDYREFKALIRYRVNLLSELERRKLKIPHIEAQEKGDSDVPVNVSP